jgi:hypothetical protein
MKAWFYLSLYEVEIGFDKAFGLVISNYWEFVVVEYVFCLLENEFFRLAVAEDVGGLGFGECRVG